MVIIVNAIIIASNVLFALLVIRALATWFFRLEKSWIFTIYKIAAGLTEFLVRPCRKITERFNTGMFDWSLLLACIVIMVARDILIRAVFLIG